LSKKTEIAEVDLNEIQSKLEQLEVEYSFVKIIQLHAILDEKERARQ